MISQDSESDIHDGSYLATSMQQSDLQDPKVYGEIVDNANFPGSNMQNAYIQNMHSHGQDINGSFHKQHNAGSSTGTSMPFTQEQYEKLVTLAESSLSSDSTKVVSINPHVINNVPTTHLDKSLMDTKTTTAAVGTSYSHIWILNSGATDHIAYQLHLLTTYKRIKPVTIKLPNGNTL